MYRWIAGLLIILIIIQLSSCFSPTVFAPATLGRDVYYMAATPKDTLKAGNYVSIGVNWGDGFNSEAGGINADRNNLLYLSYHRSRIHRFFGHSYGAGGFYGWYNMKGTDGFQPLQGYLGGYTYYGGNLRGKIFFQSSDRHRFVIRGNIISNFSFYSGSFKHLQEEISEKKFEPENVVVSTRSNLFSLGVGPELFYNSPKDFGFGFGLNFMHYLHNDLEVLGDPEEEPRSSDGHRGLFVTNFSIRYRGFMLAIQPHLGTSSNRSQMGTSLSISQRF